MPTQPIGVTGGIDTHSNTHHAAALDDVGRLLGTREFQADPAGYRQLLDWLASFGTVTRVGVEGTGCYRAGLTRFLRRHHLPVIEVNRPDRRARRVRGKSDPLDAESAARRALAGEDQVTPKDAATIVEAIRVLRIARTGAVKSRTAAYNQLKDLIITAPDTVRETLRGKTLQRVALESARLRPDMSHLAGPTQATKLALRTIAVRVATPGTYTFTAENDGGTTHALEIEGPGIEEQQTDSLSPGASGSLTVTLQSGKCGLYCPVDGHRDRGMETDITVS